MNENTICHYSTIETAIQKILFTNKLKFSSVKMVNDPFEYFDITIGYGGKLPLNFDNKIREEMNRQLLSIMRKSVDKCQNYKIACFCRNEEGANLHHFSYDKLGFAKPRMWTQYGDSHKGCCIVFDKTKLEENIRHQGINIVKSSSIEYLNSYDLFKNYPHGDYSELKKYGYDGYQEKMIENLVNHYFRKHLDFCNENEYRIVIESELEDQYIIVKNTIKMIVVSDKIDNFFLEYLRNYTKQNRIPIIRIFWNRRIIDFKEF